MAWLTATQPTNDSTRAEPATLIVWRDAALRLGEVVKIEVIVPEWAGDYLPLERVAELKAKGYRVRYVS